MPAARLARVLPGLVFVTALLVALAARPGLTAPGVVSRFDSDREDWESRGVSDSVPPHPCRYFADAGNPGGAIGIAEYIDDDQEIAYDSAFSAPAKFLGDQSAQLGTSLSFDLYFSEDYEDPFVHPYVVALRTPDHRPILYYAPRELYRAGWHTVSIPLNYESWSVGSAQPLTADEFLATLSNLSQVSVELFFGRTMLQAARLDNFLLGIETPEPSLDVTPPAMSFGRVEADGRATRSQNGSLRNIGTAAASGVVRLADPQRQYRLVVGGVPVPAGGAFSYDLSPGAQLDFRVMFAPTARGSHPASVEITNTQSASQPLISVALTGTGVDTRIVVSPRRLQFPNLRSRGAHRSRKTLTIRNAGRDPASGQITLNDPDLSYGLFLSGSDAELTTLPYTLGPGKTLRLDVVFDPASRGVHHATVIVTNPSSARTVVFMSGRGL